MTCEDYEMALNALEHSKIPVNAEEIERLEEKLICAAFLDGLAVVKITGHYYVRSAGCVPSRGRRQALLQHMS
jgi:hypothetical protein